MDTSSDTLTLVSHCPASKAADLLGDKWTLMILRAMLMGATRYSDFTAAIPRISPSVLSGRLRQLGDNGLILRKGGGGQQASYHLTASGRETKPLIFLLARWGLKWAERNFRTETLDVGGAMWDLHRSLLVQELPDGETVISITLKEQDQHNRWWIIAEDNCVDLCNHDPGKDVDIYIHAPLDSLIAVWAGQCSLESAVSEETITITGDAHLMRTASLWFPASPVLLEDRALAQG